MNKLLLVRIVATGLAAVSIAVGPAALAAEGSSTNDVSSRLVYVERLLNESSAAKGSEHNGPNQFTR